MIKLDINDERSLTFEINIEGIDADLLEGAFRFTHEGIEYGFPVNFGGKTLKVAIPKLTEIVKLKEDEVVEAKLDIVGDGYHLEPWKDSILLKSTVKMEATILEDAVDEACKKVHDDVKVPKRVSAKAKVITEEDPEEEVEEQGHTKNVGGQSAIKSSIEEYKREAKQKRTKMLKEEEIVKKVREKLGLHKTNKSKAVSEQKQTKKIKTKKQPVKEVIQEQKVATVETEEDVYNYMSEHGFRNRRMQEMLYESAQVRSSSLEVQDVFVTVKQMLSRDRL